MFSSILNIIISILNWQNIFCGRIMLWRCQRSSIDGSFWILNTMILVEMLRSYHTPLYIALNSENGTRSVSWITFNNNFKLLCYHLFSLMSIFMVWQKLRCSLTFEFVVLIPANDFSSYLHLLLFTRLAVD